MFALRRVHLRLFLTMLVAALTCGTTSAVSAQELENGGQNTIYLPLVSATAHTSDGSSAPVSDGVIGEEKIEMLIEGADQLNQQFTPQANSTLFTGEECHWEYVPFRTDPDVRNPYGYYDDTQLFVPDHRYGDKDFKGNGPRYTIDTTVHFEEKDIYASIYMKAWEVDKYGRPKSDYTTAEEIGRLNFYSPPSGWNIRGIRQYNPITGTSRYYSTPTRTGRYRFTRTDNNGHASQRYYPANYLSLIESFTVVGDTNGGESGIRTGVTLDLAVSHLLVCR